MNRPLSIMIGRNNFDTNWKPEYPTWSELVERLKQTRRTHETAAEYDKMKKPDRDRVKNGPGFVGGLIAGGRRKKDSVESRSLITLDADNVPDDSFLLDIDLQLGGIAHVIYSTHSHRPAKQKYRIVILPDRDMHPEECEAVTRKLAQDIGMSYFDKASFRMNQLMYLPSASRDAVAYFEAIEGDPLIVDDVLREYTDWTDATSWPCHDDEPVRGTRPTEKKGDRQHASKRPGIAGALNRAYDLADGIAEFLGEFYEPTAHEDRWTFTGGSTSGGLRLYPDGRAYSEHHTDPANDSHCHDLFDLVRIHLFGHLDADAHEKTNYGKLPSVKEAENWATGLAEVKAIRQQDAAEVFRQGLEEAEEAGEVDPEIFFESDGKRRRFVPKLLSAWFGHKHDVIRIQGEIYVYENGKYIYGETLLQDKATTALGAEFSTTRVKEALAFTRNTAKDVDPTEAATMGDYINFANGLLELDSMAFMPHTPELPTVVQLPIDYNPQAKCPAYDDFIRKVSPWDCIPVLDEIMGMCLLPTMEYEKAVMLTGQGGNGKGTFLALIEALLGKANTSNMSLQSLSENRFMVAGLFGKLANINADLPESRIMDSSMFKLLASGDSIEADRKNRTSLNFRNRAKLLFSANTPPTTADRTDGYFRKWLVVPFLNKFDDRALRARLFTTEELEGVMLRAIAGARRLKQQGGFTKSAVIDQALETYRGDSDHVHSFLTEYCEFAENHKCVRQALYDEYDAYCTRNKFRNPANQRTFNKRLREIFPGVTEYNAGGAQWNKLKFNVNSGLRAV